MSLLAPDDLWLSIKPPLPSKRPKPEGRRSSAANRAAPTQIRFMPRIGIGWHEARPSWLATERHADAARVWMALRRIVLDDRSRPISRPRRLLHNGKTTSGPRAGILCTQSHEVDPTDRISGTGSSNALHVDEPTSISASGTMTANAVSSANSVSYGTGNAGGNHMVTEESLSAYAQSGVVALTPNGLSESATNNIAVITTGGAKVTADIMCQNGTDASSWIIKGAFVVVRGTLTLLSSSTTTDIPPTSGADGWQVAITADTQNSAPEVVVGLPSGNTTNIDCTAHAEVITVK